VSAPALAYVQYSTGPREEWMMRVGEGPALLFLPPLFEEMNRTRAFVAAIMRRLAGEGFGCWLPDLPGTGESRQALADTVWDDWAGAASHAAACVGTLAGTVSVRGGGLLDSLPAAPCRWRFAPATGASLARDLARAGLMSESGGGGYAPSPALLDSLSAAEPEATSRIRTVRLATDRAEAELKVEGPPLWRRAEPQNSPELAETLAADIAAWAHACAA
jgi:pimeloyl-ACP methyl ester carboxylesterase